MITTKGYGGGGIPQLPEQVDNVTISPGYLSAVLTWADPIDDENNSYAGVTIVRKVGSCPAKYSDGTVVYNGSANTFTDSGLTEGVTYYYRFFAYNAAGKRQNSMRFVWLAAIARYVWKKYQTASYTKTEYSVVPTVYGIDEVLFGGSASGRNTGIDVTCGTGIACDSSGNLLLTGTRTVHISSGSYSSPNGLFFKDVDYDPPRFYKLGTGYTYAQGSGLDTKYYISYSDSIQYGVSQTSTTEYYAGTYIEDVTSLDISAHPSNGKASDGYWYILQAV